MTTEPCTTCGQTTHGEIHGGTMQDHEYEPLERCACEESEALRAELDDALARVDMLERPDRHYGAVRGQSVTLPETEAYGGGEITNVTVTMTTEEFDAVRSMIYYSRIISGKARRAKGIPKWVSVDANAMEHASRKLPPSLSSVT